MRGIFMAVGVESRSIIDLLGLKPERNTPFEVYRSDEAILVITGIGKANCAMGVAFAALSYSPDECVNCGSAGALRDGFERGGVYPVENIIEPDRPLLKPFSFNKPRSYKPYLPAGVRGVTLATMDRLVIEPEDRKKAGASADLADMEGAAFAQACKRFGLRASVFKLVTDIPGDKTGNIIRNIKKYEKNLADYYKIKFKM